ncbi:MAG: hypothetical protein BROFUL_03382 [Candidatus Brocadia fulgida]|jgi:hypothetical protein|uniref:Uncharacterized protein n=1 Tax=Candidatus Brocadia fulgida TaxID=380242 RepID=A0A0M2USG6_9BACT|nr:MAG: hypothetical protein BROFUL_03382 [Candidatus Brocadia fulgida]MBV6519559.1 hypothetical protein [Candidatus Brocadia fulgida]
MSPFPNMSYVRIKLNVASFFDTILMLYGTTYSRKFL